MVNNNNNNINNKSSCAKYIYLIIYWGNRKILKLFSNENQTSIK